MIEVSAGVVSDRAGRLLICKRGAGRRNAHLWEFPGGKAETGESAAECLIRELREELSLEIAVGEEFDTREAEGIRFHFIRAEALNTPVPTEHEDVRFVLPRALLDYDFCPADTPVARRLAFAGVRHAFWDFDGTLVDSYPAMVRAFVAGAADLGAEVSADDALSLMKKNLWHCCVVVGAENGIAADALLSAFRRHERDEMARGLPPVPGIPEALSTMRDAGVTHYVATHRDRACLDLLAQAGLGGFFADWVTDEDGLPRKPAPDMLIHLMERHGLSPAECVMIGDRPLDTEAGLAAGMLGVLLDPEERFTDAACSMHVHSIKEVAENYEL